MPDRKRARPYHQSARAEAAMATRLKILLVMQESLARVPVENIGLGEVAARAGVARSTIYTIFGSRQGLMVALAEDLLRRSGFDQLGRAFRHPDPRVALETSLREGARLYGELYPVARTIRTLSALDSDLAHAATRLDFGRKDGMAELARRLKSAGYLLPEVPPAEAADLLWVVTSFDTFAQLYERELNEEEIAARLIAMATRSLCVTPGSGAGSGPSTPRTA
jgi:AcrR family transcriptional regulator